MFSYTVDLQSLFAPSSLQKQKSLLDCRDITCTQPSSDHPTDFLWDSGLGSANHSGGSIMLFMALQHYFGPIIPCELWPRGPTLVSADHNTFFPTCFQICKCIFAKLSQAWMFSITKGFCLATLPYSPGILRIWEIVVICTASHKFLQLL